MCQGIFQLFVSIHLYNITISSRNTSNIYSYDTEFFSWNIIWFKLFIQVWSNAVL